jgi:hypothetical protein
VGAFKAAACGNLEEMTKTVSKSKVDKTKLAQASNDKTLLNCTACSSSLLDPDDPQTLGSLAQDRPTAQHLDREVLRRHYQESLCLWKASVDPRAARRLSAVPSRGQGSGSNGASSA